MKNSLQKIISKDLREAIIKRNVAKANILKLIMGELQRSQSKVLTDNEVVSTLAKLAKLEKENLKRTNQTTSDYLEILISYLPEQVSEEEIKEWIIKNISQEVLSSSKKFTSIKEVLKHFGNQTNGQVVKGILAKL